MGDGRYRGGRRVSRGRGDYRHTGAPMRRLADAVAIANAERTAGLVVAAAVAAEGGGLAHALEADAAHHARAEGAAALVVAAAAAGHHAGVDRAGVDHGGVGLRLGVGERGVGRRGVGRGSQVRGGRVWGAEVLRRRGDVRRRAVDGGRVGRGDGVGAPVEPEGAP